VPAIAAGCRLVTTRGSADVVDGPRFVAKQGPGLDRAAPRCWRAAGRLSPQSRHLLRCRCGNHTGRSRGFPDRYGVEPRRRGNATPARPGHCGCLGSMASLSLAARSICLRSARPECRSRGKAAVRVARDQVTRERRSMIKGKARGRPLPRFAGIHARRLDVCSCRGGRSATGDGRLVLPAATRPCTACPASTGSPARRRRPDGRWRPRQAANFSRAGYGWLTTFAPG
jgi:hypothetical protein